MSMWNEIKKSVENVEGLTKLDANGAAALSSQFPGIPSDYLSFLQEIGFGNLGNIQIYSGPALCNSVYPQHVSDRLASIVLIGDDMQGYCFGFDIENQYRIVEVDDKGVSRVKNMTPTFFALLKLYTEAQ